jgi:peptide/nickel transport system substrate-binding protein
MRHRLRITLIGLCLLLVAGACRAAAGQGKLVYGLTLAPSSIDPHVGASSELGIPLTSVYDPLVWLTPEGEFVPGLAERWEVSQDGTSYTFYLRQGVMFHDDTPFNASAVCVNLDRIANPETRSAKARSLLGPFERSRPIHRSRHLQQPLFALLERCQPGVLGHGVANSTGKVG